MPNLPALDVPQAQYDRLVAAFPGTTPAEKAAAYRAWLTNRLIDYVLAREAVGVEVELQAIREARVKQIRDSLPARTPEVLSGAPVAVDGA